MSVLCYIRFKFLYLPILVMFIFVLCSIIESLFRFLYLSVLVMFMSVLRSVMLRYLYFSILLIFLIFFKCSLCMLICECIWLFLFSSVVCLFFDTLQFSFFVFTNLNNVLQVFVMYLNLQVHLFVFVFVVILMLIFFVVFVSFSNIHFCFVLPHKSAAQLFLYLVDREEIYLTIFDGNLLAGDVH